MKEDRQRKKAQILSSFSDVEYRHEFVSEGINVGIAFQIRSLRKRQGLTQATLAKKMGVHQSMVAAWENPNYGKYSLETLKALAKAFDIALSVKFVSFSKIANDAVHLSKNNIAPPSFTEE